VTPAALGERAPGRMQRDAASRSALWRATALGFAIFLLVVYSQAWVFPVMGEKANEAAGGLVRALYLPAYAAGLALAASAPMDLLRTLARQPFLILLLAIVAISMTWSIAPDQTSRRVFALYCTTLGGVAVAARYRWSEVAEAMAGCFAILVVLSFAAAVLTPGIGVMSELFPGAWRGLWAEKNALGGNMAIAFVIFLAAAALNPTRARVWWGFAALALLLVLLSTSKTSLVALMLGLGGVVFVAIARRGPVAGVAMVWLAVLGAVLLAGVAVFASDAVLGLLGKDATLTGRTKIWAAAMRQIELRPWTGYGYGAVWDEKGAWGPLAWIIKDAGFKPQHAHNSWLEQWLGTGVFGLGAFALLYLQTLVLAALAVFRSPGAYLAIPLLAVYSLMSLTESIAVTYNDLRWVLFVIIACKLAMPEAAAPSVSALRADPPPPNRAFRAGGGPAS